jgi:NAD(P)-dependent dehydrogenase (short-subunit alcohol dehydrogenase family)
MIQLNLESAFLCSRAAMAQMAVQGHGKIVLTSALAALQAKPKRTAYTVAKAGIIALMQTLAQEGKDHGIQVNCLAPALLSQMPTAKRCRTRITPNGHRRNESPKPCCFCAQRMRTISAAQSCNCRAVCEIDIRITRKLFCTLLK